MDEWPTHAGMPIVILPSAIYDHVQACGWDMAYYKRQEKLQTGIVRRVIEMIIGAGVKK